MLLLLCPHLPPCVTCCCLVGPLSVFMAAGSRRKTVSPLPSVKCLPLDCNSHSLIPLADHPEVFQQNPVRKEWEGSLPRTPHLSVVAFCGHLLSRRHDWVLLSQSVCKQIWQVSWEEECKPLGNFSFYKGVLAGRGQRWEEMSGEEARMCGLQKGLQAKAGAEWELFHSLPTPWAGLPLPLSR